jgi:hypothetical protein
MQLTARAGAELLICFNMLSLTMMCRRVMERVRARRQHCTLWRARASE